ASRLFRASGFTGTRGSRIGTPGRHTLTVDADAVDEVLGLRPDPLGRLPINRLPAAQQPPGSLAGCTHAALHHRNAPPEVSVGRASFPASDVPLLQEGGQKASRLSQAQRDRLKDHPTEPRMDA